MQDNYWENIYQGDPHYYGRPENKEGLKELVKYIGKDDTVLDCGCGIGTLKKLLPNNEYTGFDYSPRAVRIAIKQGESGGVFMAADARQMKDLFNDNEFDVVVMRHFLENQEDWKEVIRQAFRICNKKVIININRPFGDTRLREQKEDTWVWDMDYLEFNQVCRDLSVSVSFGKIEDEEFVIINKHLDKAVFDLDDECDETSALPELLKLKERFPKLKVTLFCIPSKCSPEHIQKLKQYPWLELGVHGFFHDTEHGRATECNYWTEDQALVYIRLAEAMNCFAKVFRPPGWNMNIETYKVLIERGYRIADHLGHDRWEELGGERYTTGHLYEVHGHVWECNGNGIQELINNKLNFNENTEFLFVSEAPLDKYLPHAYQ